MKIIKNSALKGAFLLFILTTVFSKSDSQYEQVEISKFFILEPRVAHVYNNFDKLVKPLVERPFLPEEVSDLNQVKKKKILYENEMNPAQIIGQDNSITGAVEKPSIYTPIFEGHKTTVIHPQPQPRHVSLPSREALYTFSSEGAQSTGEQLLSQMIGGDISIPVNLGQLPSDPTLKGYETPNYEKKPASSQELSFLEKKKKNKMMTLDLDESVEIDMKTFIKQFENTKDKDEKIKVILDGKTRLLNEAREIKESVNKDLQELLESKKVAILLHNLINKYEKRAQDSAKSNRLRLADEITIKELLKDKLSREIQGLRLPIADYKELEQVDPFQIEQLTQEVVSKTTGGN